MFTHTSRICRERLRDRWMLIRQCPKTIADAMKLLSFRQTGFKGHVRHRIAFHVHPASNLPTETRCSTTAMPISCHAVRLPIH